LRVTLSGAFTVTFPNTTLWPNGVIYTPSGSGETDIINFFKASSGDWYATAINNWQAA